MPRQLSFELSIHDAVRIEIEHPTGGSGRRWLVLKFIGPAGDSTELAVWSPSNTAPELVVEDDVSIRRVKTIGEDAEEERDV